jgi:hypothetical protein
VGDLREPHRVNSRFLQCHFRFPPARAGPVWFHRPSSSLFLAFHCPSASACGTIPFPQPLDQSSLPIKARETPLTPLILSIDPFPQPPETSSPLLSFSPARAGRRAPADCSPASRDTGPVASAAQTDHSLLQPDILTVPFCPHGFDLVAGVTSKLTMSHSGWRHPSVAIVQILQWD